MTAVVKNRKTGAKIAPEAADSSNSLLLWSAIFALTRQHHDAFEIYDLCLPLLSLADKFVPGPAIR